MKRNILKELTIGFITTIIIFGTLAIAVDVRPAQAIVVDFAQACYDAGGEIYSGVLDIPATGGYLARPQSGEPVFSPTCAKTCPDGTVLFAVFHPPNGEDAYFEFTESCESESVRPDPPSSDVNAGDLLDINYGTCGAYVNGAPANGTVSINRVNKGSAQPPFGVDFIKNGCEANFSSSSGGASGDGALVTVYFQLDKYAYDLWMDGSLNLYFGEPGNWSACPNPFWVDNGSMYGRLACLTTGFNTYFLGTN